MIGCDMREGHNFDLGIDSLAEQKESRNSGFPTALAHFSGRLYESAGYIWRKTDEKEALGQLSEDIRRRVLQDNTIATLQAIARNAERDFELLAAHGIKFDGKFIAHDVNLTDTITSAPFLISFVPKVEDYSLRPHESLKTEEAWRNYVDAFIRSRRGLLEYFDVNVALGEPILWDIGKFEQFACAPNESGKGFEFVLVDSDYKCSSEVASYRKFLTDNKSSIAKVVDILEHCRLPLPPELTAALLAVSEEFEERGKELRKMRLR